MCEATTSVQQQVSILLTSSEEFQVAAYYSQELHQHGGCLQVRLDAGQGKGKGVFTDKEIEEGQSVIEEPPLIAGQHSSNKLIALVCSHCFQFLGSLEMQLAWCKLAAMCNGRPPYDLQMLKAVETEFGPLAFSEQWQMPQPVACRAGCQDVVYCSQACEEAAWEAQHTVLCCGTLGRQPQLTDRAEAAGGSSAANSSSAGDASTQAGFSGSQAVPINVDAWREFQDHADQTNDIFLVAAQAIAKTLLRARAHLTAGFGAETKQKCWEALLAAWQPFQMGWKDVWWHCVACPSDVDDEQSFRQELRNTAEESLKLLCQAIYDERFPALFGLDVYGSIVGMFELNNLSITAPSPLQEYAEALEDVDDAAQEQAQEALAKIHAALPGGTEDLSLSGTGFYAIQSCMNHSCQPNAHAMQSELEAKSFAVIAAKQHIAAGEEVTISYIDETLPYSERQEALQDYGFQCRCPLCKDQQ